MLGRREALLSLNIGFALLRKKGGSKLVPGGSCPSVVHFPLFALKSVNNGGKTETL